MDGGVAILYGNLAPDGAIIKTFSVPKEMHIHTGPARVFEHEDDAIHALLRRELTPGDVMVIRYEGPRANGMPEMYFAAAILPSDRVLNTTTAIVTDGATPVPCAGPVSDMSRPRQSTAALSLWWPRMTSSKSTFRNGAWPLWGSKVNGARPDARCRRRE